MEFEDMQVIWNSDSQEKLYAINEAALHEAIKRKGRSINHSLIFAESVMILVNLIVGIWLIVDAYLDSGPWFEYIPPALYLSYTLVFVIRRLMRHGEEVRFEPTIIGEIDKALWQVDYLIKQTEGLIIWYLVPTFLVAAVVVYLSSGNPLLPLFILGIVAPAAYFGGKWEANKFYLPKKRELEAIRETLTTQ